MYTYVFICRDYPNAPISTQEPQPDARQMQDGRRPLKCTNPVDFHLVPGELDKFVFLIHPKISQFPPLLSSISLRSSPLISIHLHYFSIIYYQILI